MNATMVDLRYKSKRILEALARGEQVNLLYRGRLKAHIVPAAQADPVAFANHPFFGSRAGEKKPVWKVMRDLRGGRYRAL